MKAKVLAIVLLSLCLDLKAEKWPTLDDYVKSCVLIVKVKTVTVGGKTYYQVIESWKGRFSSKMIKGGAPAGMFIAGIAHGNPKPVEGRELIFFFTPHNQPEWKKEGILRTHSTCFPVKNSKIVYASTGNPGMPKEYTVEDFKKAITRILKSESERSR